MGKESIKLIANNKKAYHDYFIDASFEAGISLHGTEVKSLRMGKCSIKESYVRIENGEVIIYGMHISPYEKGNIFNKDPLRTRASSTFSLCSSISILAVSTYKIPLFTTMPTSIRIPISEVMLIVLPVMNRRKNDPISENGMDSMTISEKRGDSN